MLIIGLGNPGEKYKNTRHNAGWNLISLFAEHANLNLRFDHKHNAYVARGNFRNRTITLAIPMTYMNLSGSAVISLANYYRYSPSEILVAYDDKDFDIGVIKIRKNGNSGGHNGLESIISCLGTRDFLRLRIGIGPKPKDFEMVDFVLSNFSKEDRENLLPVYDKGIKAIECIIVKGEEEAMQLYNRTSSDSELSKKEE